MRLRLVFPHTVGLILIIIVWAVSPEKLYLWVPAIHGLFDFSIPVEYKIPIKITLSIVILIVVLLFHLHRDYGKFMPKFWDSEVYFERDGLESLVRSFSAEERERLRIPDDWQDYRVKFIEHMNHHLRKYNAPEVAKFTESTVGTGLFRYSYHKIPGRQRYQLYNSRGFLEFEFSSQEKPLSILMKFEQVSRESDWVKPSIADIFYHFNIVVSATLSHIVTLTNPVERESLGHITTPTRIRFFPSVEVENTLCLADMREVRLFEMEEFQKSDIPEYMPRYRIPYAYTINQF